MLKSSSDEDIEEVNVFQKARQTRSKPRKRSPLRSPLKDSMKRIPQSSITCSPSKPLHSLVRKHESPPRKTRKLNLELDKLSAVGEPALLIPPPEDWVPLQTTDVLRRELNESKSESDTPEDVFNFPSSEIIDPEVMNMLLAQRASSVAEVHNIANSLSQELLEQISLKEFVEMRSASFSTSLLAGIYPGDSSRTEKLEEEVEVEGSASRIEKAEIDVLAPSLLKLRSKMAQEKKALFALQDWTLGKSSTWNLDVPFEWIWESSNKRAEISRLKLKLTLLRDIRMHFLQLFNDLKHEQSQVEATDRVYLQLSEQLEEAQRMVSYYQQSAKGAEILEAEIESLNSEVESLRRELLEVESLHELHLQDIEAAVFARARQIEEPPKTDKMMLDQQLEHLITNLRNSFGVQIIYESEKAEVLMPFFGISINLSTASYELHWNLPPVCKEVLEHFKTHVESTRMSLKKALATWHRALAIYRVLLELLNNGFVLMKKADQKTHVLELHFVTSGATFPINFHGTAVFLGDSETRLNNLPPQLEKLRVFEESTWT